MIRPQLILDIGGVLATNLSPQFWQLLAAEAGVTEESIYSPYKAQISEFLWTGELSEDQFWDWLNEQTPTVSTPQAKNFLADCLQQMPALSKIADWSQTADIHLLSNHLPTWVDPIINPIKEQVKSITISSSVGLRKPHPAIYELVSQQLPANSIVLFIDDQYKNLRQAELHGWRTLLADEDGYWISKVESLLQ